MRSDRRRGDWQSSAAYLYLLALPDALLAWEYLRRNQAYQRRWATSFGKEDLAVWGLGIGEDPTRDARAANPVWSLQRSPDVRLIADDCETSSRFDLWSIRGRKALLHDGRRMLLTDVSTDGAWRLLLDATLESGSRFAYALPSGPTAAASTLALRRAIDALQSGPGKAHPSARPTRAALVHMRTIQALDASRAGGTHREIAVALFGERIVSERWHPDSELRAQVRHLIRRGCAMRDGGYRHLAQSNPGR